MDILPSKIEPYICEMHSCIKAHAKNSHANNGSSKPIEFKTIFKKKSWESPSMMNKVKFHPKSKEQQKPKISKNLSVSRLSSRSVIIILLYLSRIWSSLIERIKPQNKKTKPTKGKNWQALIIKVFSRRLFSNRAKGPLFM